MMHITCSYQWIWVSIKSLEVILTVQVFIVVKLTHYRKLFEPYFNRCVNLLSLPRLTSKVFLPRSWVQHSSSTSRMVGMGLPVSLYWLTWLATCEFMGLIWMFRGKAFSGSSVNHVFSVRWLHNKRGNNKTNDNKTTTKGQEKKKGGRKYPHEFQIITRLVERHTSVYMFTWLIIWKCLDGVFNLLYSSK